MESPVNIVEQPGARFEAAYPFVRDIYERWEGDGESSYTVKTPTWKPGVRMEWVAPDDTEVVADGIGKIILHVVSVHKPGRFPTRVFFTRQWQTPDGKIFGKGRLRMATLEKFRRLARGYGHEFRHPKSQAA